MSTHDPPFSQGELAHSSISEYNQNGKNYHTSGKNKQTCNLGLEPNDHQQLLRQTCGARNAIEAAQLQGRWLIY